MKETTFIFPFNDNYIKLVRKVNGNYFMIEVKEIDEIDTIVIKRGDLE